MSNSPSARADREANRQKRTREIKYLGGLGTKFVVHAFTPYQFRINDRLDIFPTNNRWHDIILNRRGVFTGMKADRFVAGYFAQLEKAPTVPDDGKDEMIRMLEGLVAKGYRIIGDGRCHGPSDPNLSVEAREWLEEVRANGVNVG